MAFLHEQIDAARKFGACAELPSYIPENLNPNFELRPYQKEAFENFITYFENDNMRQKPTQVLFHMATGSGKTLIMAGLMINAVCLALCDSQNLRKSILITCPLVLAYNLVEGSYSGLVSESISMISALIGILRFRKTQKAENTKN